MIMHVLDADGLMMADVSIEGTIWRATKDGFINVEEVLIPNMPVGQPVRLQVMDHKGHDLSFHGPLNSPPVEEPGCMLRLAPGSMRMTYNLKERKGNRR